MSSPLDAFPSETVGRGPTYEGTDAPAVEARDRPKAVARVAGPRLDRISVVATAALTSVGVSLLTMWAWSQGPASGLAIASDSTPNEPAQPRPVSAPITAALSSAPLASPITTSGDAGIEHARVADDGDTRLVVITSPEGARVTIDGVGWGTTPLSVHHLPPGSKHVRVTMTGYRSEERVVGTDRAQTATLRISLRAVP